MSIEVECECGHHLRIPDGWKSASATCPNCGVTVAIKPDGGPVVAARMCPVCGAKFLPHESWCTHCKASFEDLTAWRRDPHLAVASGKCPACCKNMLPYESACPHCHVVVQDYLQQFHDASSKPGARKCRVCGKLLLPRETACPSCKTRLDAEN